NLPMKLIYAYGQTDDITYHSNRRGTKELNLLKYMPRVNPPNSNFFDITMVNFTVPANQTHYHCKIVRAPTFNRKQHIYRIEPVITNPDLVHHLLLYRCPPSVTEPFEAECYTGVDGECMETVAVWGVGGGTFEFPEVAGLPIGGNVEDFLYRLELHYNNPNKIAGQSAEVYNVELITQLLQIITFFLILFREGKQIDLLAADENYDFEYQEVTNLGKTKPVKLNNGSYSKGTLPDLSVIPSAPCRSGCATKSLALLLLLLCLAAQWASL
ncbi:hypothetical protein cypCar_00047693, partial [Cyprinus carpio]